MENLNLVKVKILGKRMLGIKYYSFFNLLLNTICHSLFAVQRTSLKYSFTISVRFYAFLAILGILVPSTKL